MSNVYIHEQQNRVKVKYKDCDGLGQRFNAARARSQERQDMDELTQEEFLSLLLDVWELHEERETELP